MSRVRLLLPRYLLCLWSCAIDHKKKSRAASGFSGKLGPTCLLRSTRASFFFDRNRLLLNKASHYPDCVKIRTETSTGRQGAVAARRETRRIEIQIIRGGGCISGELES
jgi:hypothetical protein